MQSVVSDSNVIKPEIYARKISGKFPNKNTLVNNPWAQRQSLKGKNWKYFNVELKCNTICTNI